jgi:antitoxin ParD1/3/4
MAATQQILVTLPTDVADLLHRKVASGEYASESEVIADSLTLLEEQSRDIEQWLREEVVPACLEFEADPSSGISPAELRVALKNDRKTRETV